MLVEIYGFPEDVIVCPNCMKIVKLCKDKGLNYSFYPVLTDIIGGKAVRHKANSEALVRRMGWDSQHPINVPQVFINGSYIGGLDAFRVYCKNNSL